MITKWVFDAPHTRQIVNSRRDTLDQILESFPGDFALRTALDAGTGLGDFAAHLADKGFAVTAIDVRPGNVDEAKRRHAAIQFEVCDVETDDVQTWGAFDLVSCFGLLYHLENPMAAVRNLAAATRRAMIVETIVAPSRGLSAWLHVESGGEDQGKNNLALIPTQRCLVSMLYHAGFDYVYRMRQLPNHPEFRGTLFDKARRTVLVASRVPLSSNAFVGPLKRRARQLKWTHPWTRLLSGAVKPRWRRAVWRWRNKLAPSFLLPGRTPWGDRWLISNDFLGSYVWLRQPYEAAEARLLQRCLSAGMVAVECGAHHGYFSLLMSQLVGPDGRVVAFEPSPRERSRLLRHLDMNQRNNVSVVESALGRQEGTSTLHVCRDYQTGCNSLRPPNVDEATDPVRVEVTTLDDFLRNNPQARIDFLKIDAEGAELDILAGAAETLARFQPLVFCELADIRTKPWGYGSADIWQHLQKRGYAWFSIQTDGRLARCDLQDTFSENLVAVPAARISQLGDLCVGNELPSAA